jgi:hypothetical protein
MVPKIMLEGGHAWVHERPIAAMLLLPRCWLDWLAAAAAAAASLLLLPPLAWRARVAIVTAPPRSSWLLGRLNGTPTHSPTPQDSQQAAGVADRPLCGYVEILTSSQSAAAPQPALAQRLSGRLADGGLATCTPLAMSCPVRGEVTAAESASGCPVRGGGGTAAAASPLGPSPGGSGCPVRGDVKVDPSNMMRQGGERNMPAPRQRMQLGTKREDATIPKGTFTPDHQQPASQKPVWEYPSPQMFFNAMRRKGYEPREEDMATVVSIHNAVNERAWMEVMKWESVHKSHCGQPTLLRFEGRPSDLSPRARMLSWLGYSLPFDRHDWTVDR